MSYLPSPPAFHCDADGVTVERDVGTQLVMAFAIGGLRGKRREQAEGDDERLGHATTPGFLICTGSGAKPLPDFQSL